MIRLGLVLASVAVTFASVSVHAQTYNYSRVVDSTQGFDPFSFGFPSLNDNGQVAFKASSTDSTVAFVQRGTVAGDPLLLIADSDQDGVGSPGDNVSINQLGDVAFWSRNPRPGVEEGHFRGSGGPVTTIVDTGGDFEFLSVVPSLNDSGNVAFQGELDAPTFAQGLFIGNGGPVQTIVDPDASAVFDDSFASPSINNAGQIAFYARLDAGGEGIFRYDGGSTFATIADDSGELTFFDDEPSLNELGQVAFRANRDSDFSEIIAIGDGTGSATVVADTALGQFGSLFGYSLNDTGQIAFFANSADFSTSGIFTGPDPLADKVIATGDELDGSIVTAIFFAREGLNNAGQIAFAATLEDGRGGIYVATIVPEPSSLALLAVALLSLAVGSRISARRSL